MQNQLFPLPDNRLFYFFLVSFFTSCENPIEKWLSLWCPRCLLSAHWGTWVQLRNCKAAVHVSHFHFLLSPLRSHITVCKFIFHNLLIQYILGAMRISPFLKWSFPSCTTAVFTWLAGSSNLLWLLLTLQRVWCSWKMPQKGAVKSVCMPPQALLLVHLTFLCKV